MPEKRGTRAGGRSTAVDFEGDVEAHENLHQGRTVPIHQIYVQDRGADDPGREDGQGFLALAAGPMTLPPASSTASAKSNEDAPARGSGMSVSWVLTRMKVDSIIAMPSQNDLMVERPGRLRQHALGEL